MQRSCCARFGALAAAVLCCSWIVASCSSDSGGSGGDAAAPDAGPPPDGGRVDSLTDAHPVGDAAVDAGPSCVDPSTLPAAVTGTLDLDTGCGGTSACGGELDNTRWVLSAYCRDPAGVLALVSGVCSTASVLGVAGGSSDGLLTFIDGEAVLELTARASSVSLVFPNSCAYCQCSQKEAQLISAGLTSAQCSPVCAGGDCHCSIAYSLAAGFSDAYSIDGDAFVLASGQRHDYCVDGDQLTVRAASWTATFERLAQGPELCDGLDNDFDGTIDNDPVECPPCPTKGVCAGNVDITCEGEDGWSCTVTSADYEQQESRCDGLDNDCDGEVDELPECAEICDGEDNDGNGTVDDNLTDTPPSCSTLGVCQSGGQPACDGANGWICTYAAASYEPIEASCDGLDNDCDGLADEVCPGCSGVEFIYTAEYSTFTFDSTIRRADPDGSNRLGLLEMGGQRRGFAIDESSGKIYFAHSDAGELWIRRADLADGANVEDVHQLAAGVSIATLTFEPGGQRVYWSDVAGQQIRRVAVGSSTEEVIASGVDANEVIAAGPYLYYDDANTQSLIRAGLDGSSPEPLIDNLSQVEALAIDLVRNRIYYSNRFSLYWARLDGTQSTLIYKTSQLLESVAVDPWADWVFFEHGNFTQRMHSDGSALENTTLFSSSQRPEGLATSGCQP